jgi:hypothetical protein
LQQSKRIKKETTKKFKSLKKSAAKSDVKITKAGGSNCGDVKMNQEDNLEE